MKRPEQETAESNTMLRGGGSRYERIQETFDCVGPDGSYAWLNRGAEDSPGSHVDVKVKGTRRTCDEHAGALV